MTIKTLRDLIADRPVQTIAPSASLAQAAAQMAEHRVGALAVCEGERLVGILSERDIVWRGVASGADLGTAPVSQAMTADPVTVDLNEAISDALATKLGDKFRHLPVMEGGRVAGLISFRDIPAEYIMLYERFREMHAAHADD